jgi:uncharacterized protein YggE
MMRVEGVPMGRCAPWLVGVALVVGCTSTEPAPETTTEGGAGSGEITTTTVQDQSGAAGTAVPPAPTLTVVGSGVAYGVPDVVVADLVVSVLRDTATEAGSLARDVSRNVIGALVSAGVDQADIRSSDYSLFQEYDWSTGPRVLLGFRVRHSYSVKLDVASAGRVLDAAVAASWDALEVQGTRLMLDDTGPLVEEARAHAWSDCVATADELAALSGMTLGDPIRVEEGASWVYPGPYLGEGANGDGSTSLQPGRISAVAEMTVEFAVSR